MRIADLSPEQMTPEQRRIRDEIAAGPRGKVAGPFRVWLHSPELADRAQKVGEFLRYRTTLPSRLSELAILVTARFWNSQYEWFAHEPHALKAGLDSAVIAAVARRVRPTTMADDEAAVHDLCVELLESRALGDATHDRAVARLGARAVVELVGVVGYYTMVALTLNAFAVPLPEGAKPPLAP